MRYLKSQMHNHRRQNGDCQGPEGSYCFMGTKFLTGKTKEFQKCIVVMAAQYG